MTDDELCRRCGERPGRERFYTPNGTGQQSKVNVKKTVGCDPCWEEFIRHRTTSQGALERPKITPLTFTDETTRVRSGWWPDWSGWYGTALRLTRDSWELLRGTWNERTLRPIARAWQVGARAPVPALMTWVAGLGAVWTGSGWEDGTSGLGLIACGFGAGQALRWALEGARWPWQRH